MHKIPWERFFEDQQPGLWQEYWTHDDLLYSMHPDALRPTADSSSDKADDFMATSWSEIAWLDDDFLF